MASATRRRVYSASNTASAAAAKVLADEKTQVVNVTVTGNGRSGPYYPGDAKNIQIAATGTCKFQIRGSGGTDGLADSAYRELTMSAEVQTATATKAGILTSEVIPYEFYLFDTSGSSNPVTMYISY